MEPHVDRDRLFGDLNEGILAERRAAFERNLRHNLPLIRRHGGLKKIIPELSGKAAVVIGAGPSLETNLALLKRCQQRRELIYIAVDMALGPLSYAGIRPHFVISCEASPVDFFGSVDTADLHLLAFSCVSCVNLRKWRGDMSFYNWMIHRPEYDALWEEAGRDLGFLGTGSLVTTQAAAFALGSGASALVLVGNDLGFADRYYARGTVAHRRTRETSCRLSPPETLEMRRSLGAREYRILRGARGYYTTRQFLAGKLWLEDLFRNARVPVYDCSDPGCSEKYVAKIELRDFMGTIDGRLVKKRRNT
jgi:hypothetical protein